MSGTATSTARTAARERPYEPVRLPHHVWAGLVADELAALASDPAAIPAERAWCAARVGRVRYCGTRALVQQCRCGAAIPGSVHALPGPQGWCESRGCPVCSRRRSAKLAGLADRAAAAVPAGSTWWLLTGTTARDPFDPSESHWAALRGRVRRCRAGITRLVRLLRRSGELTAAWSGIEVAGNGHVHAHTLIVLPPGDVTAAPELVDLIRAAGFDDVADARQAGPETVVEVVKYSVKSPSWESAVDPDTSRPTLIHPRVAAHWQLATRGVRLCERYGLARGVPTSEEQPQEEQPAAALACPCCASVDELDRWWRQGASHRVADWARRTWQGRTGLRLAGRPWPREGPAKTAVATWAAELFSGGPAVQGYSVETTPKVDTPDNFRY